MSTNQQVHIPARVAGADLTTHLFKCVKSNGTANQVVVAAAAGDEILGVIQNAPNTGQPAAVCIAGSSFAIAGAAITTGALLTSDATGRVVTAAAGNSLIGHALEAASAANQRILIAVAPQATP